MCSGGGGSRATIYAPDTGAYDKLAQQQLDLLRQQQDSGILLKQSALSAAIREQQDVTTKLRDVSTERASNTNAYAARLAALIGSPPPEKAATAPVVGDNRSGQSKAQGKKGLRIERTSKASSSAGSGLNITSGA
jgi:hypothetical protein